MDYHGAFPSQSPQHAPPSPQSSSRSLRPLPTLPPHPNNATYHTPQYMHMPAAPQPLHPMAGYTPGISASSSFLQPVSRSAYSAQSVYGTPQEYLSQSGTPHLYTPAQTHQQDVEMLEDHTPRHMPGGYEPTEHSRDGMSQWVAGQRGEYQQTSGMMQNAHPYGAQTPTQLYGAQQTPTQQSHSTQYNQLQRSYDAQPGAGPSTTSTQQNPDHISQSSHEQIIRTEYELPHKVPSHASTRNGYHQLAPLNPAPSQSHHQSSPFIPPYNRYQQRNATPGPLNGALPRVDFQQMDFQQNKRRIVIARPESVRYDQFMYSRMTHERRNRREAESTQQHLREAHGIAQQQLREADERARQAEERAQQADERAQQAEQQAETARKAQELEGRKQRAEYESSLATISRRFEVHGSPLPPRQQQEFPNAPPALQLRYISQTTRETRQLETITRNVGGDLPDLRQVHEENVHGNRHGRGSNRHTPRSSSSSSSSSSGSEDEGEGEGVSRKGKGRLREILGSDKQALKGLIKELMKDMNVGKIRKSKSRRKVSRATSLHRAKKTQQLKMTKDEDLNCKTVAREIFRLSTRLHRAEDFKGYKPATDAQEAQCGDPNGERLTPGVSSFYFGKGYKTSMWNDMLLRGLVADLRRKQAEDPNRLGIPDVSTDYLIALFLNCVKEGRYNWFDHDTKEAKNSRACKDAKWKKRTTTAKKMTLLCRGDPKAIVIWQWVKRLLALLGTLGMSSEDTKPLKMRMGQQIIRQTTHVIQICPWRPKQVTETLALVDLAADQICLKKGTAACPRIRGNGESRTPAPQGLPITLYDEQWIEDGIEMDPDFKDDLCVSDEAFEIMELVAENLGIEVVDEQDEMNE
ncbi:hypothetical protein C8R44DRAFT_880173 [Mycena epipterygia]|nr:hypothetical protein C8R44DRAFT_880173 [Mycena epipterygia]